MEKQTLNYTYEVGGGTYTISDRVTLPKKGIEWLRLKIKGWSNARYFVIDRVNGVSYFQASAEGQGCHRCGICQKRMKEIGGRRNHDFVEFEGYASLYQKNDCIPPDLTVQGLRMFMGLDIIEVS